MSGGETTSRSGCRAEPGAWALGLGPGDQTGLIKVAFRDTIHGTESSQTARDPGGSGKDAAEGSKWITMKGPPLCRGVLVTVSGRRRLSLSCGGREGRVGQGRSWLGGKPSGLMLLPAQRPPPPWAPPPVGPTLSHVGLHPRTDHFGQQAPGLFSPPGQLQRVIPSLWTSWRDPLRSFCEQTSGFLQASAAVKPARESPSQIVCPGVR